MSLPNSFDAIIQEAHQRDLYSKLIIQFNKDFLLANVDLSIPEGILPDKLKAVLHEMVYKLISEKFSLYLNLLYIIDVSEKVVKKLDGTDLLKLSEEVSFLILKREWQKVWYKNKFQ